MKNKSLYWVTVAGLALALGACASKPPVQEEVATAPPPPATPSARPTPTPSAPPTSQVVGPAPGTVQDFIVNVGDRVYFDTDAYNLDSRDMATLDRQVAWLKAYPNVTIIVAGNCDERGTREYNLALGESRAKAVAEVFLGLGVSTDAIRIISYGEERPVDLEQSEDAWSLNRRVEVLY